MIPSKKVEELILKHKNLEGELSSGNIDKNLFATKSKEYSDLNEIIDQAKEDSQKIVADANKEIHHNMKKVKQQLLNETGDLAVQLAKQILKRDVNINDQQKMVKEALGSNK